VDQTNGALGEVVGKAYVAKYFPPAEKARAQKMVANIVAAFRARIEHLDWMSPATKAKAVAKLATEAPGAAAVRELYGLTLYRLERWRQAASELEAYRTLTGSVDQNPVLADCYRALRRYREVEQLWDELREASPSAAVVFEGRIVMAGALADRGELAAAVTLLEPVAATPRRVRDHHIRLWYVLADLYDRSGDLPRARSFFGRIAKLDPDFADVRSRLAGLGR